MRQLPNPNAEATRAWQWMKDTQDDPAGKPEAILTPGPRQVQRRLRSEQEGQVVAAYVDGKTVYEVGAEFDIHRTTVSAILKRRGIKLRRSPKRGYTRTDRANTSE